jgi:hypothetical protein
MKRFLTTILLATVLAGIPVFATGLSRTERKAGLTSARTSPAPASPQYRRRRYRRRYVIVRRRVYRRRHYRRIYLYRRGRRRRY